MRLSSFAVLAVLAFGTNSVSSALGASVHSGSGAGVSPKPDGSTSSTFINHPATTDTISWLSGSDIADEARVRFHEFNEAKLDFSGSPGHTGSFSGRTFTGVHDHITGGQGSSADSRGSGKSEYVASPKNGSPGFYSFWGIWAEGHVGSGTDPHYDSRMEVFDPICLRPSDLADATAGYSLLVPTFISGAWGTQAGIGLHVSIETKAGTTDLLDIALGHDGVAVTGGNPNLLIYPEDSLAEGQPDPSALPMSLGDIQAWLSAHVVSDSLSGPLTVALILSNQSVPADTLADGSAVHIHVDSRVWESGAAKGFVTRAWRPFDIPAGDPGLFVVPDRTPVVDLTFDPPGSSGPGGPDADVCLYGGDNLGDWALLHAWDWNGGTTRSFIPVPGLQLYRLVGDAGEYPITGEITYPVTGHSVAPDGPKMTPNFALGGVDYFANPFNPNLGLGGGPPPMIVVQPGLNLQAVPEFIGTNHWQYIPLQFFPQPDPSRPWLYLGGNPSAPLIAPTYLTLNLAGLFDPSGNPLPQLSLVVQFTQGANTQFFQVTATEDGSGNVTVPPINLGSILDQPYRINFGPTGFAAHSAAQGAQSGVGYFQLSSVVVGSEPQATAGVPRSVVTRQALWLSEPMPNPSSGVTSFDVSLAESGPALIEILDVRGGIICKLFAGILDVGSHRLAWDGRGMDGRDAEPGVYFAVVEALGRRVSQRISLVR